MQSINQSLLLLSPRGKEHILPIVSRPKTVQHVSFIDKRVSHRLIRTHDLFLFQQYLAVMAAMAIFQRNGWHQTPHA